MRLFNEDDSHVCSRCVPGDLCIQDVLHHQPIMPIVCDQATNFYANPVPNIKMMAGQSNNNFGDLF